MTIEAPNPNLNPSRLRPRRSLARLIAAGVALGLVGVAVDRLFLTPAALPVLLQGLEDDKAAASRTLAARIAAHYPPGSGEAQLQADLAAQGFAVGVAAAKWSRAASGCRDFAEVDWIADAGRVRATGARVFRACGGSARRS